MINDKRFEEIVERRFKLCKEVLFKKAKEYAANDDRLHNFHVAAALEHCDTKQALFGMMAKHIVSIADMCTSDKQYPDEVWDEKLGDLINYALLMDAARIEEKEDAILEGIEENRKYWESQAQGMMVERKAELDKKLLEEATRLVNLKVHFGKQQEGKNECRN